MTNDLVREVEDSIRQEQLQTFWKEYGPYLVGAAVLAVLLTAAVAGWRGWTGRIHAGETTALLQALDTKEAPAALEKAEAELTGGRRAAAGITAAGLLARDGKQKEAADRYRATAQDGDVPRDFRQFALLMAVRTEWAMEKDGKDDVDSAAQGFLDSLQTVWSDESSPWRWHAFIQAALILAHDRQDYAQARRMLDPVLAAQGLAPSLAERARALDHVYALKESANRKKEEPAPATKPEG